MELDVFSGVNTDVVHEWHAVFTVQLGELIEEGAVNFAKSSWSFDNYSDEQQKQFYEKFSDRYYFAEICMTPPLKWQKYVLRVINEQMPWLKFLYKIRDELLNQNSLAEMTGEYEKYRKIFSEFPQAQLSANADYASNGDDFERQKIYSENLFDLAEKVRNGYVDPDLILLNKCEKCFMPILTAERSLEW